MGMDTCRGCVTGGRRGRGGLSGTGNISVHPSHCHDGPSWLGLALHPSDPPAVLACGSSHDWHAEPLSSVLTFLCSTDLPACRKVRLFEPAVTPYRWPPDLTIRNDVVGVWNKCGTDSDGQVEMEMIYSSHNCSLFSLKASPIALP